MTANLRLLLCALVLSLVIGTAHTALGFGACKPAGQRRIGEARTSLQHVMGRVTEKGSGYYLVRGMGAMSMTERIEVTDHSHLFLLQPAKLSQVSSGWQAHAIGVEKNRTLQANMLVLFPPRSSAGVPPPSSGMSGIGKIVEVSPVIRLQAPDGHSIQIAVTATTAVRIAEPIPFSDLRVGDFAMTFGTSKPGGMQAQIVHVRREAGPMQPGRRMH